MNASNHPGPKPRPKRRFGSKVQYIVTLDTGRLGDWIVAEVEAGTSEQQVVRGLTRTQRKKVQSVKLVTRFNGTNAPEGRLF
jgi:hypothetical protein